MWDSPIKVKSAWATQQPLALTERGRIYLYDVAGDVWSELPEVPNRQGESNEMKDGMTLMASVDRSVVSAVSSCPPTLVFADGAVFVLDGDKWLRRAPVPGSWATRFVIEG